MSMVSHRLDIAFSHLHSIWKQILKCATVKTLFERVQSCSSVNILTVKTLFERVRCCSSFNILWGVIASSFPMDFENCWNQQCMGGKLNQSKYQSILLRDSLQISVFDVVWIYEYHYHHHHHLTYPPVLPCWLPCTMFRALSATSSARLAILAWPWPRLRARWRPLPCLGNAREGNRLPEWWREEPLKQIHRTPQSSQHWNKNKKCQIRD